MQVRNRAHRAFLAAAAGVACLSIASSADAAEKKWQQLTEQGKAGTPADVIVDKAKSNLDVTSVDVTIHGFWTEEVKGPDGLTYQRIEVPGLPNLTQIGAPTLPSLRAILGVANDAKEARLTKASLSGVQQFSNILVWPQGIPELDEEFDPNGSPGSGKDSGGTPEQFKKDPGIYNTELPWPPTGGVDSTPVAPLMKSVRAATCEAYPVKWNPLAKRLDVAVNSHFEFIHKGAPQKVGEMTKDTYKVASKVVANWELAKLAYLENVFTYAARYLIVTPQAYVPTLQPLIDQKKAHGFVVTVIHTENITTTVAGIRSAIQGWYALGSPFADHYCLLVGDTNVIPLGSGPSSIPTDDLYGSPLDGDLCEEVYVGRFSVDSQTDLAAQVKKTLAYEDNPFLFGKYNKVLLVAHDENAPGKYEGAQEAVRTASYAVPPTFSTLYGSTGVTNANVNTAVNGGLGLLCYRGHGDTNIWWHWNTSNQDYHKNDVLALTNTGLKPVVWSFCCTNQDLAANSGGLVDCLGETWMEVPTTGAVAHYGATVPSGTYENHELDYRMFKAVYDLGLITHAQAIEYAEAKMLAAYPSGKNAWMYLLLGDPAMKIRRRPPLDIVADFPFEISVCPIEGPPCDIGIKVTLPEGLAIDGALVSLWKPGSKSDGPDEVLTNGYTDKAGFVKLAVKPVTGGPMMYSVRDDEGNVVSGEIVVKACPNTAANSTYGTGKAGTLGVPALAGVDLPLVGQLSSIKVSNALPGAKPFLVIGGQSAALPFDKGTLLVVPISILPIPVPVQADGTLTIAGVIPANPALCGLSIYHQMLIPDPKAIGFYHLALTNGLKRTFGS